MNEVNFPMTEVLAVIEMRRTVGDAVLKRKSVITAMPCTASAVTLATFGKVSRQAKIAPRLRVDVAIDRLMAKAEWSRRLYRQTARYLFWRPAILLAVDDGHAELVMMCEFPQSCTACIGQLVGDPSIVAIQFRHLPIRKPVAFEFAVDF